MDHEIMTWAEIGHLTIWAWTNLLTEGPWECGNLFQLFLCVQRKPDKLILLKQIHLEVDNWPSRIHRLLCLKFSSQILDVSAAKWCISFHTFYRVECWREKVPVGITMGHQRKTAVSGSQSTICNEKWMFQCFWIVCLIIWKAEPISLMLTKHFWQVIWTHLSSLTLPNGAIYFPGICWKWLAKMCAFCTLQ